MEIAASPARPSLGRHALLSTPAEPPPALRLNGAPFTPARGVLSLSLGSGGARADDQPPPGCQAATHLSRGTSQLPAHASCPPWPSTASSTGASWGWGAVAFQGRPRRPSPPHPLAPCLPAPPPPQRALLRRRVRVQVRVCEYMWSGKGGGEGVCAAPPAAGELRGAQLLQGCTALGASMRGRHWPPAPVHPLRAAGMWSCPRTLPSACPRTGC